MPLLDNELARRRTDDSRELELRPEPLRVRWAFDGLLSSDGHELRAAFECSVRALPEESERRMLREVLLDDGQASVTSDVVASHFKRALQTALAQTIQAKTVADALADSAHASVVDRLKSAAHPVAFASGVEIVPPFHLELESPTFQQQRLREMHRGLAERHAAGQVEHLNRAGELLKQFQSIRQSAPELTAGQVLQRINPADQGSMLQSLLLASAEQSNAIELWAASGPYLVRIDPGVDPPKPELTPLPPTLGPLRSVQPSRVNGQRVLLVGARSGFIIVRPDSAGEIETYADPRITSQLGFSAVAFWSDRNGFIGCHGDAGIVRWKLGEREHPSDRLDNEWLRASCPSASATAVARNLEILDEDRAIFSVGNTLVVMNSDSALQHVSTASTADVVAILPDEKRMVIVHEDGNVCAIDRVSLEIVCRQRAGSRVRAAGALPWLGTTRLLLATEEGAIKCVGLEDPLVTQYASTHRDLRAVAGSADVVAAVSGDRQRLILWHTWDGRQPNREIYLTGLTRHRTADVMFG